MNSGTACYAVHNRVLILKLVGCARVAARDACKLSAALESFIQRLPQRDDFEDILIDLTETSAIDSTHLGLLAQVAQFSRSHGKRRATILSNEDITFLLESVGFDQVFAVVCNAPRTAIDSALDCLPGVEASEHEPTRLILAAHQALIDVHKPNAQQFQNVVELFEAELRRNASP